MNRLLVTGGTVAVLAAMLFVADSAQAQSVRVQAQAESAFPARQGQLGPSTQLDSDMCQQGEFGGGMFAQSQFGFAPPQKEGDAFIDGVSQMMQSFERPMPMMQLLIAILQQLMSMLAESGVDVPAGGGGGFGSGEQFAPQSGG